MTTKVCVLESYRLKQTLYKKLKLRFNLWRHRNMPLNFRLYIVRYGYSWYVTIAKPIESVEDRYVTRYTYIILWSECNCLNKGDTHKVEVWNSDLLILRPKLYEISKEDIL